MHPHQYAEFKDDPVELDLLTEKEAAQLLRVSRRHLQRLVHIGQGPPRVTLGERRVAYPRAGLARWVAARTTSVLAP
jgi:excisionase family DNA binding protein